MDDLVNLKKFLNIISVALGQDEQLGDPMNGNDHQVKELEPSILVV